MDVKRLGSGRDVATFLESVASAPFLAVDTETSGLDPRTDRLLLVQFGTADRQGVADASTVTASDLNPIFRADRPVVFHNAKFDVEMLWSAYGRGLAIERAQIVDSMLAECLLRNGCGSELPTRGFSLEALASRYAGMALDKSVRRSFVGASSSWELSEAELAYAARDVEATWKVFASQLPLLERDGLLRALAIEGAAVSAFADMELRGVPFDGAGWRGILARETEARAVAMAELDRAFEKVADVDLFGKSTLAYDSDAAMLGALGALGIVVASTRREVLAATGHPAAIALARYREHQKLVSTYGESFLSHVHPKTGRIHGRFHSMGAITGRASCRDPNLQNVPADSAFRHCFVAPPGRKLVTADYAAAELRILAEMSGDPVFTEA